MKILKVLEKIKYTKCINKLDIDFESVSIDSRNESDMFVGIKGTNTDGSNYYMDAFNRNTNIAVVNHIEENDELLSYLKDNNKMVIVVEDTTIFLQDLASYKRNLYNIPVVGVTGSSGKTSTKDFINSVLSQKYKTLKTMGNYNNHLGVPLTILSLRDHECAVVEMGMDHFHEIELSSLIARPTIALINNVGWAHIELLGSRKGLLKAKLEILAGMEEKRLVVNNDNDLLHDYANSNNVITFGIDNKSNYMCEIIETNEYSSTIRYKSTLIKVPVGGVHFIYNAMAAISIGEELELSLEQIKKGIEECILTSGRSEIIKCNGFEVISDAYNANLDAMTWAVKYLGVFKRRKIAVLGTMGELADMVDDAHKQIGHVVGDSKIDILITVGDHTEFMNKGALEHGLNPSNSYHLNSNEEAINKIKEIVKDNDIILVKASHFNNFIDIVNGIK